MREARAEQGTLIASGLMAGAAIFGIITAVLRLDWTSYAIRFLSSRREVHGDHQGGRRDACSSRETLPWYDGLTGQGAGLAMFVVLALACFVLARWGASKELGGAAGSRGRRASRAQPRRTQGMSAETRRWCSA